MQSDTDRKFYPGKTRIKYGGAVIGTGEIKAINKVLSRNWWTLDDEGRLFSEELAKTSGVKHVVLTNSGSSALLVAFSVLDLPQGSEVIIPAVNFPTAVNAVLLNGYTPVFIDVDLGTYCLNLSQIEKAMSDKTRAVLAVNIAGNMPDLEKLQKLAKKNNLIIILDNCDGYGSKFAGKPVETYADISVTSFHAAHIITMGEGGAVFTNRDDWYKKALSLREWGRELDADMPTHNKYPALPKDYPPRYTYLTRGFNLKPIELQAAMGRVQLRRLKKIVQQRQKNFEKLYEGLTSLSKWIILPKIHKKAKVSWFSFPITLKNGVRRQTLLSHLEKANIETRVIFAGNILRQPGYKHIKHRKIGGLKNADDVLFNSFFISVHPSLTNAMTNYVISTFQKFFSPNYKRK